jgi:hypothetical protein
MSASQVVHPTLRLALVAALLGVSAHRAIAQENEGSGISRNEFDALLKELNLKSQPWASVPWKVSVTEARQEAAKQKKPIFLVVNTGNCLGFV